MLSEKTVFIKATVILLKENKNTKNAKNGISGKAEILGSRFCFKQNLSLEVFVFPKLSLTTAPVQVRLPYKNTSIAKIEVFFVGAGDRT